MKAQEKYQQAIIFAAHKHNQKGQKIPGTTLPYVVHLSNVAMEVIIAFSNSDDFDLEFAVQVALLHDTMEDTFTTYEELEKEFGLDVANAVSALTKNKALPKEMQMTDCLERINKLQKEVWAIKLADRITNLQKPPLHWEKAKKVLYQEEARTILNELKDGNSYLAERLRVKIEEYRNYFVD